VDLDETQAYPLAIRYHDKHAHAKCKFLWRPPDSRKLEIVPKSALFHERPK
jgi:hypothetical protein